MWTIFKVFTEFLVFYVLAFWLRGMWDLSSPTRDRTHTPCIGRQSLNHRTTREVPKFFLYVPTSCLFKDFTPPILPFSPPSSFFPPQPDHPYQHKNMLLKNHAIISSVLKKNTSLDPHSCCQLLPHFSALCYSKIPQKELFIFCPVVLWAH